MKTLLIVLLIGICSLATNGYGRPLTDSLTRSDKRAMVAEMARIIRARECFNGGTLQYLYETWADTTKGLKLYIATVEIDGPFLNMLVETPMPVIPPYMLNWSVIDFEQPIKNRVTRARGRLHAVSRQKHYPAGEK